MTHIRWTPAAAHDLETIVLHSSEDHPESAREVADQIFQTLQKLLTFPAMGRPGKKPGTRELVFAPLPYIAVYRIASHGTVEVLRIWHGAQQGRE